MLPLIGLFALGIGVGVFGTLIGAGGGFILVPILLLLFPNQNPSVLTAASLFVVMMNAGSGTIAYARMKRVDYKSALLFSLATIPGAVLGAVATSHVERRAFDLVFGALLILVCAFLLIFPERKVKRAAALHKSAHTKRTITDSAGTTHEYVFDLRLGLLISGFVGFISSFLGIGGGIVHVPALSHLLDFPVHIATATSHFILAITALVGTLTHLVQSRGAFEWNLALPIGFGALAGAQLGAILSNKVHGAGIIRALAGALGLVGIRILFMSAR